MPKPFYENHGKALNREDIPLVIHTSEYFYDDDPVMLSRIKAIILDFLHHEEMNTPEFFKMKLDCYNLEISIDENDPDNYLLLKFKQ